MKVPERNDDKERVRELMRQELRVDIERLERQVATLTDAIEQWAQRIEKDSEVINAREMRQVLASVSRM